MWTPRKKPVGFVFSGFQPVTGFEGFPSRLPVSAQFSEHKLHHRLFYHYPFPVPALCDWRLLPSFLFLCRRRCPERATSLRFY